MLGLVDQWKRGGSRLQERANFRLVRTSIGPLTTRVLCADDLSGEIYEWGWVDTLARSTPSQPKADFRTAEDDVDLHGCDDDAAAYVDFDDYGNEIVQEDGLVDD